MLSMKEILVDECCPCCLSEKQTSCWRTLWQVRNGVRSAQQNVCVLVVATVSFSFVALNPGSDRSIYTHPLVMVVHLRLVLQLFPSSDSALFIPAAVAASSSQVREKHVFSFNPNISVFQCIRAELFLVSLHMLVIVLGVLKEALDLRQVAEDLHFAHSLVETIATVLIIVIRHVSAWHAFKKIKRTRRKTEHVDVDLGIKTRSRSLKVQLKCYSVVSVMIALFAVVCFVLFYFLAHLGWTILSNNAALIWIMACDGLLRSRMGAESRLVLEDHRKAVLCEMSLLLKEATNAPEGPVRDSVNQRVERFQKAFKDTDCLNQPEYISLPENHQMDQFTTLQVFANC